MASAIHLTPSLLEFDYNGASFDLQVFNRQDLVDAVEDPANEGLTIMVRAGDYGGGQQVFNARRSVMTTVRAWPGDAIQNFPAVQLDASYLRWQGFDMSHGGFDTLQTGCHHIEILDNYIHDGAFTALALWAAIEGLIDHDIVFERNHVARLVHLGQFSQGYCVVSRSNFDQFMSNIRLAYNTIEDTQADGAEMASVDGFEFIGNDVTRVLPPDPPIPDPHPDGLMLWAGTTNATVKDNRFVDVADTLFSGGTTDVVVENNLIYKTRGRGVDGGASGTSPDNVANYTFRRNTVYFCLTAFPGEGGFGKFGCVSLTGDTVPDKPIVLEKNLFGSLNYFFDDCFDLGTGGGNVIQNGLRPYPDDLALVPQFADLIDLLPLNLPDGYEDCGYRRAACGHLMR